MMNDTKKSDLETPFTFVKTRGTLVTGRHKDKKERISEAMCDLRLAIDGVRVQFAQPEQLEHPDQFQQSVAALARACSIFLRKIVIGDQNKPRTRLLDDETSQSLGIKFDKLTKVTGERKALDITRNFNGGTLQLTKLDDVTMVPQSVHNMPIAPFQFKISVEWPLPGTVNWVENPTQQKPWKVGPEELFGTNSNGTLNCSDWLAQQLVMFDNRGIALKEIIRTIVNFEGAHSINVARLNQTENEEKSKLVESPEVHILNNIKLFGIKYNHIIIIELALYLFNKLYKNEEIENPKGEIYVVEPAFSWPKDVFLDYSSWLTFDGGIISPFGDNNRLILHKIRAVK